MREVVWNKNGDHPYDHVGEPALDVGKLCELKPELLTRPFAPLTDADIPPEAYYPRIEGAYVRFFRVPDPEFAGDKIHYKCGRTWHDHGWIDDGGDGAIVCPGMVLQVGDTDALAQ